MTDATTLTMEISETDAEAAETVVLLHGLGLGGWAMWRVQRRLLEEGYRVINLSYPSRRLPLERLAAEWLPAQLRDHGVLGVRGLHFVTHSMGGILLRAGLRETSLPVRVGRVVMIAPPNHGSEVADRLGGLLLFRLVTGVNGWRLGTGADSLPRQLGPWPEHAGELGVIAGNRSFNPLFNAWLGGLSDSKVAVDSTRLEGMRDFIVLPCTHTWMQWNGRVLEQTCRFLRHGRFSRPGPD